MPLTRTASPLRLSVVVALVAAAGWALAGAASAQSSAQDYLEGAWVEGAPADQGSCRDHYYHGNQLEFEFRKSGGRLLYFEPPDLYTAIAIGEVSTKGDVISLTPVKREGAPGPSQRLRRVADDRFEFLSAEGVAPNTKPHLAYRCGAPDLSVTGSVGMADLAVLTPSITGGQGLLEIRPGEDDRKVCGGTTVDDATGETRRWLQFELLGPLHYWVMGDGGPIAGHAFEFDRVRSVRKTGDHTLTLDIQRSQSSDHAEQSRASGESGLVVLGHGTPPPEDPPPAPTKPYTLTVIDKGGRVEIPELAMTFVRCHPDEPGSWGMHRM